jgi:hypothetical protein
MPASHTTVTFRQMLPSETLLRLVERLREGDEESGVSQRGVSVVLERASDGGADLYDAQVMFRGIPASRRSARSHQAAQALRDAFALLRAEHSATTMSRCA